MLFYFINYIILIQLQNLHANFSIILYYFVIKLLIVFFVLIINRFNYYLLEKLFIIDTKCIFNHQVKFCIFTEYQGMNNTGNSKSPSNQQVAQQQAKPQPIRPLRPVVTQQQRPVQPVARKQPLPNHHSNPSATPAENSSNRVSL